MPGDSARTACFTESIRAISPDVSIWTLRYGKISTTPLALSKYRWPDDKMVRSAPHILPATGSMLSASVGSLPKPHSLLKHVGENSQNKAEPPFGKSGIPISPSPTSGQRLRQSSPPDIFLVFSPRMIPVRFTTSYPRTTMSLTRTRSHSRRSRSGRMGGKYSECTRPRWHPLFHGVAGDLTSP